MARNKRPGSLYRLILSWFKFSHGSLSGPARMADVSSLVDQSCGRHGQILLNAGLTMRNRGDLTGQGWRIYARKSTAAQRGTARRRAAPALALRSDPSAPQGCANGVPAS